MHIFFEKKVAYNSAEWPTSVIKSEVSGMELMSKLFILILLILKVNGNENICQIVNY